MLHYSLIGQLIVEIEHFMQQLVIPFNFFSMNTLEQIYVDHIANNAGYSIKKCSNTY